MADPWFAAIIRNHGGVKGEYRPNTVRVVFVSSRIEILQRRLRESGRLLDPWLEIFEGATKSERPIEGENYPPERFE